MFAVCLQIASSAGVPVFLDAGGASEPISQELIQHITLVSPNETELQRLSAGMPTSTEKELLAAATALQQQAQQTKQRQLSRQPGVVDSVSTSGLHVLLKLGTAGSMYVSDAGDGGATAQGVVKQAAIPATKVVDTTGMTLCVSGSRILLGLVSEL